MERLRRLRKEKQVTQKEIAEFLGVDRTTYVKYETGGSEPNFDTIERLADYFSVSVDYLLGRIDDPQTKPNDLDAQLEGIDFALYNETKEMTDAQKRDVLKFVRFLKQQNGGEDVL